MIFRFIVFRSDDALNSQFLYCFYSRLKMNPMKIVQGRCWGKFEGVHVVTGVFRPQARVRSPTAKIGSYFGYAHVKASTSHLKSGFLDKFSELPLSHLGTYYWVT